MEKLVTPLRTKEIINQYGFHFRKKFGQNFLIDAGILNKIIAGAMVTKQDMVLEIGPGIGTMTQYLANAARKVIAVEIDEHLIPILKDTLDGYDNVKVIHSDILKMDIVKLVNEENAGKPIKVVANLPYYITTPIIMKIFESGVPADNITVMVQKEVAARLKAEPGTKDYGALSLAVQYYAKPEVIANVPRQCFMPRPNVDSTVIRLTKYKVLPIQVKDEGLLFKTIRAAFNQRRKTLVNALSNSGSIHSSKADIVKAIEAMGLSPTVRGEALTLEQFARLADYIYT